jgi:hypothetical protein
VSGTLHRLLTQRIAGAHRAASGEDHLSALDGEAAPLPDREDEPLRSTSMSCSWAAFRAAEVGMALVDVLEIVVVTRVS